MVRAGTTEFWAPPGPCHGGSLTGGEPVRSNGAGIRSVNRRTSEPSNFRTFERLWRKACGPTGRGARCASPTISTRILLVRDLRPADPLAAVPGGVRGAGGGLQGPRPDDPPQDPLHLLHPRLGGHELSQGMPDGGQARPRDRVPRLLPREREEPLHRARAGSDEAGDGYPE